MGEYVTIKLLLLTAIDGSVTKGSAINDYATDSSGTDSFGTHTESIMLYLHQLDRTGF